MTSQSSTNNKISLWSLMREDLRHKTWMIALSILGSFLAGPLLFLFILTSRDESHKKIVGDQVFDLGGHLLMSLQEYHMWMLDTCTNFINRYLMSTMLIIAFAGAMIVAFYGFQFLYNKRKVDLYHSAPVSRRKLFTAIWLNGFLIWFVPAFFCSLIVFILAAIYMKGLYLGTILGAIMVDLLRNLLCFLMVYNACLVGVMISGNYVNAMINALTYGLLVFGLIGFLYILIYSFLANVYFPEEMIYGHPLYVLSPLTTPIILLIHWLAEDNFYISENWHMFGGTLVMLVNLKLSYTLYLKRPSELSERGLEAKWAQIPFRACISLMSGITFCMFFFVTIGQRHVGWQLFGIFFGTTLAFCILNIIYHGAFKELFSHKLQYGIVLIAGVLLFFGMYFDVFGYARYLPAKSQIVSLSLDVSRFQSNSNFVTRVSSYAEKKGRTPNPDYVSYDTESIYNLLKQCTDSENDFEYGIYTRIKVKVNTKLGSYYRTYQVSSHDLSLLAPFVESEEYAKVFYPVQSLQCKMPDAIQIGNSYANEEKITDRSKIEALMQAFHQDFEEHRTIPDLLRTSRFLRLNLQFYKSKDSYWDMDFNIPYWYEHSISLIKSWYPDKKWDPKLEDIASLTLNDAIMISKTEDALESFWHYWGYEISGTERETPYETPYNEETRQISISHHFSAEEIQSLKGLEPYLIWGSYSHYLNYEQEYLCLGHAELKDGRNAVLYIRYGKLPLSTLRALANDIVVSADEEYNGEFPEAYYYYD